MKSFLKEETLSTVGVYMSEIGRFPLLDAHKEITLARQYECGREAQRQLDTDDLNAQERAELQLVVERGQRARQRLIQCNLRFVISMVRQYAGCGVPFVDLVQEGNLGLIEAAERFDHRRGVRFASYAGWWIRQTILRALAHQGRDIRLPSAVNDELNRLHKASAQLETRLQRSPTHDELAAEMQVSTQRVRQLQDWDRRMLSLDRPIGENDDALLSDVIPDPKTPPLDETVAHRQLEQRLHDIMVTHLTSRDQRLLSLRFGLGGAQGQTLREVAGILGITQERARQVEKKALKRLRRVGALHELGLF
jgi:RNA polymerase sigma factor (sigma-70 family)